METVIERKHIYEDRTIGGFYDEEGKFRWYTMEDKDRKLEEGGVKIPGQTAIPRGRYKLELGWSPKRRGLVPFLRGVPQFTDIQVHVANTPDDVEGCVGVGKGIDDPVHIITMSVAACIEFYLWLLAKVIETKNDVWVTVK